MALRGRRQRSGLLFRCVHGGGGGCLVWPIGLKDSRSPHLGIPLVRLVCPVVPIFFGTTSGWAECRAPQCLAGSIGSYPGVLQPIAWVRMMAIFHRLTLGQFQLCPSGPGTRAFSAAGSPIRVNAFRRFRWLPISIRDRLPDASCGMVRAGAWRRLWRGCGDAPPPFPWAPQARILLPRAAHAPPGRTPRGTLRTGYRVREIGRRRTD